MPSEASVEQLALAAGLFWALTANQAFIAAALRGRSLAEPSDRAFGAAAYVPHWLLGVADGGPGHCFPSGHAAAAFAFFGLYFLWRPHRPRLARVSLAATLIVGIAFGRAQLARGAHFASHTLWTAWLCWTTASVAAGIRRLAG